MEININCLPPGWETKMEPKTGKKYYVNYFTDKATLEDPRVKLLADKLQEIAIKEKSTNIRHVPIMGASLMQSNTQVALNESLIRIRSMFPTVPETHIKALLIKYHGREAVVVSALQVEKYPVATPGPYTPPPSRNNNNNINMQKTITHSPLARRPQPKPHSPKMKLRYLKSVFPIVEETVLLDTLCNSDNNVTFATQRLIGMGFDKRDTPPPPRVSLKKQDKIDDSPKLIELKSGNNRIYSPEEKEKMKMRLFKKYSDIPERVIMLALESAEYNESTTETILGFTVKEKESANEYKNMMKSNEIISTKTIVTEDVDYKTEGAPLSSTDQENTSKSSTPQKKMDESILTVAINDTIKNNSSTITTQKSNNSSTKKISNIEQNTLYRNNFINEMSIESFFKSPYLIDSKGPDYRLVKGANTTLLLDDYVPWLGPQRGLAKGPNANLRNGSRGAIGPNLSLRKGPIRGLARGSIYSNSIMAIHQESRSK